MKKAIALVSILATSLLARTPDFGDFALQESLSRVPPKFRAEWLARRGYDASYYTTYRKPESTGLRLVGKWGRGPAVAVTGRDSLVALTLGSEVALLSFVHPQSPRILSEIQVNFLPIMSTLYDSFLLIGGNGIEVWNIACPSQPVFCNVIPYRVSGFAVFDTFLYFVSRDTFRVYSIGNPTSPYCVGFCLATGSVGAATEKTAVLRQGDFLGFIDVSNPKAPVPVGSYPGFALSFAARGTICCAAISWNTEDDHFRFEVLDISDPANASRIGAIDSVGGYDIHLSGPLAFVSGYYYDWEFTIVDITDSTQPKVVSSCATPGDNFGVWAEWTSNWAYVADYTGLAVIDIANLNAPHLDTVILKASQAQDIWLDGNRAYVADYLAGMKILDVSDPMRPQELSGIDTTNPQRSICEAVAAQDSFAYMGWPNWVNLLVIDVSDPSHPVKAGGCDLFDWPVDIVLRDSFLYVAQAYRFQVVNVARPRQPVLVGSCNTHEDAFGLAVQDSLAYLIGLQLQVINISSPGAPIVVSTTRGGATGIAVRDTFLYIPYHYDTLWVFSVADPVHPRLLWATPTSVWPRDVVLGESKLYVGTSDGWGVDVYDLTNPGQPVKVGRASAPYDIRRLCYLNGYLYAAMWDAGVGIYETTATGLMETPLRIAVKPLFRVLPTLTRGNLSLQLTSKVPRNGAVRVLDVAGRVIMKFLLKEATRVIEINLAEYPPGVYWCEVTIEGRRYAVKVVKQ